MKRILTSLALLSFASAAAAAATPIEGRWQNPKDSVIIDVAPCGAGTLCGRVSWASPKAKADARKGGTQRLIGTRLLSGLKPNGEGGWKGRAYLPKRNMHATALVHAAGGRTMVVKGCLVGGLVCKEQRWTRVN